MGLRDMRPNEYYMLSAEDLAALVEAVLIHTKIRTRIHAPYGADFLRQESVYAFNRFENQKVILPASFFKEER